MNDHPASRTGRTAAVEAIETIGGVLMDLTEVAERLPVRPDKVEETARILDRLSEELAEAAGMLRTTRP